VVERGNVRLDRPALLRSVGAVGDDGCAHAVVTLAAGEADGLWPGVVTQS
jgi:hypothetical protein